MATAFTNATIMTITQGTLENATLLIDEGKIKALGVEVTIPKGADIIDCTNKVLSPGFIDAHCHVGLFADGVGWNHSDGNEATDPITPHLRALDALNPDDMAWPELVAAGVTTVLTGPGSANCIGGQWICVKTQPKPDVADMILLEPAGMKMAMGENPRRAYGSAGKMSSTRMGNAAVMREAFVSAQNYGAKLEQYVNDLMAYELKIDAGETDARPPETPERNLKWEAILPLLSGAMIARIHAHRADDILTAIRIMEEFGIRYTIEHATEGFKIASILAEKGVQVTCGPHLRSRSKFETRNRSLHNPAQLAEAGVKVAIQTDDMSGVKFLPIHAAAAVKYGMKVQDALEAITINAAEIIGVADRVGSLEVGKDADIVVLDGDPLDILSHVECVFIDGECVFKA